MDKQTNQATKLILINIIIIIIGIITASETKIDHQSHLILTLLELINHQF